MLKHALHLVIAAFFCVGAFADLPRIRVSDDHRGFVQVDSNKPFIPWGFNYDRDFKSRLIEDYWETEWPTVEQDFREMKALGANVVRVHLQFGKFMDSPDRPHEKSLAQLSRLLKFCESIGMRLDITGLGSYRHRDVPKWYDDLDEKARWQAQANFWDAIAKTCANSPAVFFYDLINEPIVPNEKTKVWMVGHLGDFDYCQHITRDPAGRNRDAISRQWTRMMVSAIRKNDPQHLISIGLLPFDQKTFGESGFSANAIAPEVDFLCTHLYPQSKKLDESLRTLKSFQVGKPVVIEEIYPIGCTSEELKQFIEMTRGDAAGWISFYWGQTIDQLKRSKKIGDAIEAKWLETFNEMNLAGRARN